MSEGLKRALDRVERPLLFEPSVKFIGDEVRDGRFLVSFPRAALGPGPSRVLRTILAEIGAPNDAVAELDPHQSAAASVHFGHEDDGTTKCYLEFAPDSRPAPELVFLAIKWRGTDWTLSHYLDRTPLTKKDRAKLVYAILPTGPHRKAIAALDTPRQTMLEVIEPGTPRRSIDVNLAERRTTIGDQRDHLLVFHGPAAADHLDRHAADALGHIAAGTARDGQLFTTLYHGAYRVHGPLT